MLQETLENSDEKVSLSNLDRIDGIYALDWFDEDTILIKKQNSDKSKVDKGDGTKSYPDNLYLHNIKSGKDKLLVASTEDINYAIISPDKSHVFYQEGSNITATGYIYNLQSKKTKRVTEQEEIPAGIGRWIDNTTVILYSYLKGEIFAAEINGYRKQIVSRSGLFMRDPVKVDNKVYFVTDEYKLYVYEIGSKRIELLQAEAAEFIPDFKGRNFAFIPLERKNIEIRDAEGNKKNTLWDKGGIGGFGWSKNSKNLAYIVYFPGSTKDALFIAEAEGGKTVQITKELTQTMPYIVWSPSGNRLLVPGYDKSKEGNKWFTVIIELK
jgi:hypothetical protein